MSGIFTFLTGSIDNALDTFVVNVSTSLAIGIAPIVVTGLTIYFVVYGYAVMRGAVHSPLGQFVWDSIKLTLILAFALSAGLYQSQIVSGVNGLTAALVQMVSPNNAAGVFDALDQLDHKAAMLGMKIIDHGVSLMPLGGYVDFFTGLLIFFADSLLLLIMGGWALMAKAGLTIVLAFGPLFIACLAFKPTAQFFHGWMSKTANYVLLTALMAAISTFAIAIATSYIENMDSSSGTANGLADGFGFLLLTGVLIVLTLQMPSIAAGLTGGQGISGGGLWGVAGAALMGKMMGSSRKPDTDPDKKQNGGNIQNGSSAGSSGSDHHSGNLKRNRVPAYQRAALTRLNMAAK